MNFKKILIFIFLSLLNFSNSYALEADVFVQSTVNRASQILSMDITKQEKINKLKIIAKETVDIEGVGFFGYGTDSSMGVVRQF